LERRGFTREQLRALQHAYRLLLASKRNTSQALDRLRAEADDCEEVQYLLRFVETSERGVLK
jgi:UDP-N-acetylglucosamine acyltransferase